MALIDNPADDLTLTQRQAKTTHQIKTIASNFFQYSVNIYGNLFELFWNNPNGLTPQEVADALGAEAADLFISGNRLKDFINETKENSINYNAPNYFTINPDGTVEIGLVVSDNPPPEPLPEV